MTASLASVQTAADAAPLHLWQVVLAAGAMFLLAICIAAPVLIAEWRRGRHTEDTR